MSYISLYRKFRPDTFDKVVGQEHITETLKNQIKTGRIGNAYLFTGSRGTGKTSCARIFARAINCENPKDGSPCSSCSTCRNLGDASNIDISEIDAASNNGVDDARELRERAKYPPVHGKYKVFIVDEVHMLTGNAFNALLKTLEEPPASTVFILATTEAHKLPATILSRCMRFDFALLPQSLIEGIISDIYDKEGKKYETEAISYIAASGEGSVRDALSVADKCMSISSGKLTYQDVLKATGSADIHKIAELFGFIADGELGRCLTSLGALAVSGKSPGLIAKELLRHARNLLVAKAAPETLEMPEAERSKLKEKAAGLTTDFLSGTITIFSEIEQDLRYSLSPRIILEAACIRACKLFSADLSALEERILRLEKRASAMPAAIEPHRESVRPEGVAMPEPKVIWGKLITHLRNNESGVIYGLISAIGDYSVSGDVLTIFADENNYLQLSQDKDVELALSRSLTALGFALRPVFELKKKSKDLDKEIQKIKRAIGDVPIGIE